MQLATTRRSLTVSFLASGLLLAGIFTGVPRVALENRTSLYLLGQWRVAMGDTNSGVELLARAASAPKAARGEKKAVLVQSECPDAATP